MRHLEWLVQVCFMWHVMKIIKTHGELLSKGTIFQLQKHPAVNRDDNGDVIKNIPKICYDQAAHNQTATANAYRNSGSSNNNMNNTAEILNIFKTILQQLHNIECEQIEGKEMQGDLQPNGEERSESQYEVQPFSILQQLKLDEQKEKWQQQQQQQQQQLKLHLQQQQNALKLQEIMQHLDPQSLGKAGKKKKKKKKKKKRKKKKKPIKDKKKKRKKKKQKPIQHQTFLQTHPAHILFASPTQKPQHYYHDDHYYHKPVATTTKKPYLQHPLVPIKKIKYILRKNTIFKKKKKEYLNHLKHVLYPFVKFIAFFTILNPFTLAVFLFTLISPVVFGFLGFIGLSFLIKPALHLLFGVKQTVNTIKRQKLQQLRKRQRLRDSRRPITIHKHYYQQKPIAPPSAHHRPHHPPPPAPPPKAPHHHSHRLGNRHQHHRQIKMFNPILPDVRQKLKKDPPFITDFKGYKEPFELI